ncbi:MAG: SDR family oxidoreductase [Phycisphaerales bacterium]|nr:SDR family oxidoreductase [Phycisphaerales bacterium]
MPDQPLQHRTAIVTGASAGIGEATALALARRGARVILNARRAERLRDLATAIAAQGGKAAIVAGDAADEATVRAMLNAAPAHFGAEADLVVVNAGRGLRGSPLSSERAEWEEMIRINFLGAAALMRAAAERMLADLDAEESRRAGADRPAWLSRSRDIVVISSNVGKHVSPFSSMYGSSKFAITAVAEGLRREIGPRGVRVSAIHPGVVRSEFQQVAGYDPVTFGQFMDKIGPVLTPEDVARTVEFIVSQPAHCHVNDVMLRPTRQDYP